MNRAQYEAKLAMLQRELHNMEQRKPACKTCKNFDHLGSCELAPGQFVPTEVLADGCSEWHDDGIPF